MTPFFEMVRVRFNYGAGSAQLRGIIGKRIGFGYELWPINLGSIYAYKLLYNSTCHRHHSACYSTRSPLFWVCTQKKTQNRPIWSKTIMQQVHLFSNSCCYSLLQLEKLPIQCKTYFLFFPPPVDFNEIEQNSIR